MKEQKPHAGNGQAKYQEEWDRFIASAPKEIIIPSSLDNRPIILKRAPDEPLCYTAPADYFSRVARRG